MVLRIFLWFLFSGKLHFIGVKNWTIASMWNNNMLEYWKGYLVACAYALTRAWIWLGSDRWTCDSRLIVGLSSVMMIASSCKEIFSEWGFSRHPVANQTYLSKCSRLLAMYQGKSSWFPKSPVDVSSYLILPRVMLWFALSLDPILPHAPITLKLNFLEMMCEEKHFDFHYIVPIDLHVSEAAK